MKKIVVGISGASGIPLAIRLLTVLRTVNEAETHLVMTRGAELTAREETRLSLEEIRALADVYHERDRIGVSIASGSFRSDGMIVVPCSMKTLAGIACGYSDNLLLRAADVMLKERRKLILVVRETPISAIHLRNMLTLTEMGAVILPPVMTYYHSPHTIEDMEQQVVGKMLDMLGIKNECYHRWNGNGCE